MSHTIKLQMQIRDRELLARIAQEKGLGVEHSYSHHQLGDGMAVFFPDWTKPVIVQEDGTVAYDNWHGRWGDIAHLNDLVQSYVVETVQREARMAGHSVWQEREEDGTMVLRVGGAW